MKRPVFIFLLLFILYAFTEVEVGAQLWKRQRYEASAGLGPSFFFGDIGGFSKTENVLGFKDLTFLQTRANMNVSAKYRVLEDLNARLSLTYGLLRATDSRGSNESRSMESSISVFEPALIAEFYFIKNKMENSYLFSKGRNRGFTRLIRSMDFYAFSGFGGLKYSIRPNEKLENRDLTTSGFTPVIPLGLGGNLIYTPDYNFGFEVGGRYTFTDYIDGYTSQYSSSNDVYYFLTFSFTYKLKTGKSGWPSFR